MTRGKKIALVFVLILLLGILFVGLYLFHIYSSVTKESIPLNTENLAINKRLDNKVINIAFFGIDGRDDEEVQGDRTDVIMIGTLDTRDNSIKLTSVMRDTFVKICVDNDSGHQTYAGDQDGIEWNTTTDTSYDSTVDSEDDEITIDTDSESETDYYNTTTGNKERVVVDSENEIGVAQYDKINAAFTAGVESSIKTLNENFDLNIEDYVTVDFDCLMNVVDALGGIEVDIANEDVLYWTNKYLQDSNFYGKRNDPDLTTTGPQVVTGAQALAFARIRYSDSDYGRTMRQREVVQAIFDKVKSMDAFTALNLLNQVYPYVQTSLSLTEITEYARVVLGSEDITFEDYRIPANDYGTGGYVSGIWYLFPDTLLDNCKALHKFIYGPNDNYIPSSTVKQISQEINDYMNNRAYDLTYKLGVGEDQSLQENENLYEAQNDDDITLEDSNEDISITTDDEDGQTDEENIEYDYSDEDE